MPGMSIEEATRTLLAPGSPYEVADATVHGVRTRVWKNSLPSLRSVVEQMPERGARDYLVYEDERLTYEQAYRRIAILAQRLRQLGVSKGDRVAIAMRNYPEWVIAFWAATSAGAVVVPLNAWWQGEELAYGLTDSASKVAIVDDQRARLIAPHAKELSLAAVIVARARDQRPDELRLEELIGTAPGEVALPECDLQPDDDATIFYTSGTTGRPKGALGTHRNICTNIVTLGFLAARSQLREQGQLAPAASSDAQQARLVSVPFFHVTGCHSTLVAGTYAGAKLVMMYKWNPERALELIERERVTSFGGVPSMVWQVLESPDFVKRDTSSVTSVGYGGAPAAPELVRRIKEAFPGASPRNGYGMTETSSVATSNSGIDYVRKPDSVGPPIPVCDAKIVDAEGRSLPPGQVGELMIAGPNVVKGYWNKPESTGETFDGGWVHTGDIAKMDEEGFVYIVDRAKDMVIRGGENVYCVEVEDVLYSHPDVVDAAVIGIPHRILGEEVGAVVQLRPGASVTDNELMHYCAQKLAAFKVPVRVELRGEPLPRNANGKILKPQLKRELGLLD